MKTQLHTNTCFASAAFLLLAATIYAADSAPNNTTPKPVNYNEHYGVLSERNIFLKERGVKPRSAYSSTQSSYSSSQYSKPPLEAAYVLTGIVLEDGQYRAYVEDTSTGRVSRLAVGDPIARGHVMEIEIDAIAYDLNGQGTWITPGSDLRGQPFAGFPTALSRYMEASTNPSRGGGGGNGFATSRPSFGSGESTGVAPPPLDPNTAGLSVEERMRLRRLQGK